ncbi:hypothetical protein MC885_008923, partial [Smutsia gigantea]
MALLGLADCRRLGLPWPVLGAQQLLPDLDTQLLQLLVCLRVHQQQAHGAERSVDPAYHLPVEAVAVGTLLQAAETGQGCPSLCVRAHLALRQLSGAMRGPSGIW